MTLTYEVLPPRGLGCTPVSLLCAQLVLLVGFTHAPALKPSPLFTGGFAAFHRRRGALWSLLWSSLLDPLWGVVFLQIFRKIARALPIFHLFLSEGLHPPS